MIFRRVFAVYVFPKQAHWYRDLTTQDFLYYYEDFWIVVGHSFDTLKAAVMEIDNEMEKWKRVHV